MKHLSPSSLVLAALALTACARSYDDVTAADDSAADAQRARELPLLTMPPIERPTVAEFAAQTRKELSDDASKNYARTVVDAYGRLGFFPLTFDPLAGQEQVTTTQFGAFYSSETKTITLIGKVSGTVLVHELVHALQDQHFDLKRFYATGRSTDEEMAKRGLIEGDAELAELRVSIWEQGGTPTTAIGSFITVTTARGLSEQVLGRSTVPLFFMAYPAFAYSYGAAYVKAKLGLDRGRWSYDEVNALFAESGPASTQEVLRGGGEVDAMVPTGLSTLPFAVHQEYETTMVDRMGEWHTYLLLRGSSGVLPSVAGVEPARELAEITRQWDGDQLVLLRKKDGMSPPSRSSPAAIVWTSIWDSDEGAASIRTRLVALHTGLTDIPDDRLFRATDGEEMWVEQRGNQVCFVKNLDAARMEMLAREALSTRDEKRLGILRTFASTPIVH